MPVRRLRHRDTRSPLVRLAAPVFVVALGACSNGGATDVTVPGTSSGSLAPIELAPTSESVVDVAGTDPTVDGGCPQGDWTISHLTLDQPTDDAPLTIDDDVAGATMLVDGGRWTLSFSQVSVAAMLNGEPTDVVLDGTASGDIGVGGEATATVGGGNGSVTVAGEPESRPLGFEDFVAALAPDGELVAECSDDTVSWHSTAATLTMVPTPAPTTDTAPPTDETLTGDSLRFGRSPSGVITCAGRPVTITGTGISVRLDGACASITIEGNSNSVFVDQVATIDITGVANAVVYTSGSASVTVDGEGNTVEQGTRPAPPEDVDPPAEPPAEAPTGTS